MKKLLIDDFQRVQGFTITKEKEGVRKEFFIADFKELYVKILSIGKTVNSQNFTAQEIETFPEFISI
jgi:hypothetical protein